MTAWNNTIWNVLDSKMKFVDNLFVKKSFSMDFVWFDDSTPEFSAELYYFFERKVFDQFLIGLSMRELIQIKNDSSKLWFEERNSQFAATFQGLTHKKKTERK